jgi:hypothetical protein
VPNYGRHLYWLQKSAESGHLEALFDLAGYHAEGFRNIEKDINRALELYDSIRSEFPRAEEMYQVYSHELKLPGQKSS